MFGRGGGQRQARPSCEEMRPSSRHALSGSTHPAGRLNSPRALSWGRPAFGAALRGDPNVLCRFNRILYRETLSKNLEIAVKSPRVDADFLISRQRGPLGARVYGTRSMLKPSITVCWFDAEHNLLAAAKSEGETWAISSGWKRGCALLTAADMQKTAGSSHQCYLYSRRGYCDSYRRGRGALCRHAARSPGIDAHDNSSQRVSRGRFGWQ